LSLTGFIFLVAFAAGCLLAFVRHPIYGAVTYVAVFFLSPPLRWWGEALPDLRWAVLSAGVTLLAILFGKKPRPTSMPVMSHGAAAILLLFVVWLAIQSDWALDPAEHGDLLGYYAKFFLALFLVYKCVDSEEHLRLFMWAYVLGCFYFGCIAFISYIGGRFEGFGGAGTGEANAAAVTVVAGIFVASSLFLAARWREKALLLIVIPFIVNALVTTISRSGFLALAAGGIMFAVSTPRKFRRQVRILSVFAAALFLLLTGPSYWERMQSIEYGGGEVQGVDTGAGRLELAEAQWRMFRDHPLGCGAMCTAVLSPKYLEDRFLANTVGGPRERASHNTIMTMLVEHGIPGVLFYFGMLLWIINSLLRLRRVYRADSGFMATAFPGVAAVSVAIVVGDLFVSYAKFEVRIWFIAVLMAMLNISMEKASLKSSKQDRRPVPRSAPPRLSVSARTGASTSAAADEAARSTSATSQQRRH
jgi:O-antigen ligase